MLAALFEKLARALDSRAIPYMLIGGQAVLLYGEPRLTKDVDVTLGVGPERLGDLLSLAGASGWKVLVDDPADFVERTLVLPCQDPSSGLRIDFIFSLSGYERQALDRAKGVAFGGTMVRFAALEDLLVHKIVAGRPRDLEDAKTILGKHPEADLDYVRRWLGEFESSLGEPLLKILDGLLHP